MIRTSNITVDDESGIITRGRLLAEKLKDVERLREAEGASGPDSAHLSPH